MEEQEISRKKLEEIMFSLSFKITTDEDIQFINNTYLKNQSELIFGLTNTKLYFEQIIVPYCQQNFTSIIKTINVQNIQNQFRNNFEQRKNISVPNYEKCSTNFQIDISSCGSENQLNCDNLNLIEGVLPCNRIHNYVKFGLLFIFFLCFFFLFSNILFILCTKNKL